MLDIETAESSPMEITPPIPLICTEEFSAVEIKSFDFKTSPSLILYQSSEVPDR